MPDDLLIHTIGHANHETTTFIDLLHQHEISLVVDVRSQPYSQWASQFNRELLAHDMEAAGIAYHFMGDVLGGCLFDMDVTKIGGEARSVFPCPCPMMNHRAKTWPNSHEAKGDQSPSNSLI